MNIDEEELVKIFKETDGVVATYFFGSQVKGKTDHFSDFDFAVLFRDGWQEKERFFIVGDLLCKAFSVVGQDKADVVVLSNQPLWFQQVVVKTGKVIYETDREERMKYERELMRKCLQEGLPEYVEDGKMKKQDVQINFETIEENLKMLGTLSHFNYDEFMADFRNLGAAVYWLQTSIEALADISRYVIRSLSLPPANPPCPPFDKGGDWQIPMVLSDAGYIDPRDAEVYIKMVRFRNLVVHHYYRVNPEEIYRIVTDDLDYIRRWRDRLLEIIEEQANV